MNNFIELIHDTKRNMWGIPIDDGRYYYFAQVLIDSEDYEEFLISFLKYYGVILTSNMLNIMRMNKDNPHKYIQILAGELE